MTIYSMLVHNRLSILHPNELFNKSKWGRGYKERKTIDLFWEHKGICQCNRTRNYTDNHIKCMTLWRTTLNANVLCFIFITSSTRSFNQSGLSIHVLIWRLLLLLSTDRQTHTHKILLFYVKLTQFLHKMFNSLTFKSAYFSKHYCKISMWH